MKKGSLFGLFMLTGLLILLLSGLYIITLINQTREYDNNNCTQIRECMILHSSCREVKVTNFLFGFEWDITAKDSISDQRKWYFNNCFEKGGVKE